MSTTINHRTSISQLVTQNSESKLGINVKVMPVDTRTQMNKLFSTIILQIEKEEVGNRTDTGLGKKHLGCGRKQPSLTEMGLFGQFL